MCFSEMPFHPERLQTTRAFSLLIISFSALLNMYHYCNFVHDKVFAGFDNFPGQNIIQCTD